MLIMGEKNMAIKRIKLNYMPAVSETPPIGKITIPSGHIEALDRVIEQKIRQSEKECVINMETVRKYIVRSAICYG